MSIKPAFWRILSTGQFVNAEVAERYSESGVEMEGVFRLIPEQIALLERAESASSHLVEPGDTLISLALRYHVSVSELVAMNQITNPT
jgi:hypothetical protein